MKRLSFKLLNVELLPYAFTRVPFMQKSSCVRPAAEACITGAPKSNLAIGICAFEP